MRTSGLLVLFLAISVFAAGQPETIASGKIKYFNSFQAGGLFGKKGNGSGESFSMIHGIRVRKMAYGIGTGYDAFQEWRTLPIFGSVSYDFLPVRGNTFFIQLNAGHSVAWYPNKEGDQYIYTRKRGPMIHPLLGYRIRSEKFHLYLTAGYKFQGINYIQTPRWPWWDSGWGQGGLRKIYVGRDIERISLQLGFGFH